MKETTLDEDEVTLTLTALRSYNRGLKQAAVGLTSPIVQEVNANMQKRTKALYGKLSTVRDMPSDIVGGSIDNASH